MSSTQRRSGRIARRIPILLLGSDTSGHVFAEETVTLVLSRHGAGVLCRYRLAPDETLTMRLPGGSQEVEVRLVGQLGQQGDGYVYGVAFRDPEVDFWGIEFPPAETLPGRAANPHLECELCGARQTVKHGAIEEDVYAVNESVLRFCERCGLTTSWRRAASSSVAEPVVAEVEASPIRVAEQEPEPEPVLAAGGAERAAAEPEKPSMAPAILEAGGLRANRRKHVRTKVTFQACVRFGGSDEVVECDNVSRGGLCFRSRRSYPKNERFEIAAPYSVGEPPIFADAEIRRIDELPSGLLRYGVEYVKASKTTSYSERSLRL